MTKAIYTIELRKSYVSDSINPEKLIKTDLVDTATAVQAVEAGLTFEELEGVQFTTADECIDYVYMQKPGNIQHNKGVFEITCANVYYVELDADGEPMEYTLVDTDYPTYNAYAEMFAKMIMNACESNEEVTINGKTFEAPYAVNGFIDAEMYLEDCIYEFMMEGIDSVTVESDDETFSF